MEISASMVKELRERSGAGMMECKKALVECNGEMETAAEWLRKNGIAKAVKKSARVAAEGAIIMKQSGSRAIMVEVNSETDFVAKDENFRRFAEAVADTVLQNQPANVEALMAMKIAGGSETVETARAALVAKIGENVSVRRFVSVETGGATLGSYMHGSRIGVLANIRNGDAELAKDIAMHIAASKPLCVDESGVPADLLAKEKEIYTAQVLDEGKPANMVEKIVDGKVRKYLNEVTLLGQPFVKDDKTTVGKLLSGKGASVVSFMRMEVGEGIEKKVEDFAAEVMKQAQGG